MTNDETVSGSMEAIRPRGRGGNHKRIRRVIGALAVAIAAVLLVAAVEKIQDEIDRIH
jgi:hypothetical protein